MGNPRPSVLRLYIAFHLDIVNLFSVQTTFPSLCLASILNDQRDVRKLKSGEISNTHKKHLASFTYSPFFPLDGVAASSNL